MQITIIHLSETLSEEREPHGAGPHIVWSRLGGNPAHESVLISAQISMCSKYLHLALPRVAYKGRIYSSHFSGKNELNRSTREFKSEIIIEVDERHYLCDWLSAPAKPIKFSLYFFNRISIKAAEKVGPIFK